MNDSDLTSPSPRKQPCFLLICAGRRPSSGETDERFILRGRQGAPDIRVWPGLIIQRRWHLADGTEVDIDCGVDSEEGEDGRPVYFCQAVLKDGSVGVKGATPTAVACALLKKLPGASEGDGDPRLVKGPRFFGLRSPKIVEALSLSATPAPPDSDEDILRSHDIGKSDDQNDIIHIPDARVRQDAVVWRGIHCVGNTSQLPTNQQERENWQIVVRGSLVQLKAGFKSQREVLTDSGEWVVVSCMIEMNNSSLHSTPLFAVEAYNGSIKHIGTNPTTPVRRILSALRAQTKHRWCGKDFFGLHHLAEKSGKYKKDEDAASAVEPARKRVARHQASAHLIDSPQRVRVPTSQLLQRKAAEECNEAIHKLVEHASFGDVENYIQWLCCHHRDLVVDALSNERCQETVQCIVDTLSLQCRDVVLSDQESAQLLVDAHLSQQAYKAIRTALIKKKVALARYESAVKFIKHY